MFEMSRFKRVRISGYESPRLIEHISSRNESYRNSLRLEGIVDAGLMNSTVAVLSTCLRLDKSQLDIVDLGGGGGHLFETLNFLFPTLVARYTIIETNKMVESNIDRQTQNLTFMTMSDFLAIDASESHLLIANSSLQYLENPLEDLELVIGNSRPKFVFIGKTPFHFESGYIMGTQRSLLTSNGPKGGGKFSTEYVEYEARVLPFREMHSLFGVTWKMVYGFDDGKIELRTNGFPRQTKNYFTKSLFFERNIVSRNCDADSYKV